MSSERSPLASRFLAFTEQDAHAVPNPGHGRTRERFAALMQLAAEDVALAKLAEAHLDAVAILAEAGRESPDRARLGVWASGGRDDLSLEQSADGVMRLTGVKGFCTGAPFLTHALVTARYRDGVALVLLDVTARGVKIGPANWVASAFAAAETRTVVVDAMVDDGAIVGATGFYLERPGFWWGAAGIAACWAGGAKGLAQSIAEVARRDVFGTAAVGASVADCWGLEALVMAAADAVDGATGSDPVASRQMATALRHVVAGLCGDVLRRCVEAGGPRPFVFDADVARHADELRVWMMQHHGERELSELADAWDVLLPAPGRGRRIDAGADPDLNDSIPSTRVMRAYE